MTPSISQQLQSMKRCLEETIIPELPKEATFAREQASFMAATLNWLLQTHEHQYRYEVVENVECRALLSRLSDVDEAGSADCELDDMIRGALLQEGPSASDAAIPLQAVVAQTRHVKQLVSRLFNVLCEKSAAHGNRARRLLGEAAISQGRRERAFFKGTGFTISDEDLGAVLGECASSS